MPGPYVTADGHDVSGTYFGVHVVDGEDVTGAFTHDQQRAASAVRAHLECAAPDLLTHPYRCPLMVSVWIRYEERDDGEWIVPADEKHSEAIAVTWVEM